MKEPQKGVVAFGEGKQAWAPAVRKARGINTLCLLLFALESLLPTPPIERIQPYQKPEVDALLPGQHLGAQSMPGEWYRVKVEEYTI